MNNNGNKKITVHILYPSGWDVDKWSEDHEKGLVPDKYQYGFNRLEKYGFNVTYARFPKSLILKKIGGLSKLIFKYTFDPYYFIFQLKHFPKADVFISPLDPEGLTFCWLRKHKILNLHKKKHVYIPAWLPAWIQDASNSKLEKLKSLLSTVDVLMHFGESDKTIYKEHLLIPDEKLVKIHWGVDGDLFQTDKKTDGDGFILSPGNDEFRDFETLAGAASELPQDKFIITSSVKLNLKTKPLNLHIINVKYHKELVDLYVKAKAVIIPLKKGCQTASGTTVLKEALLLNKKIIVSSTDLMRELTAGFEDHVTLIEPGSKDAMKEAILASLVDRPLPELMPDKKLSLRTEYYMGKLAQIISRKIEED